MTEREGHPRNVSRRPSASPRRVSFVEALRREKERQRVRALSADASGKGRSDPDRSSGEAPGSMREEARRVIEERKGPIPDSEAERKALALEVIVELETELARIQSAIVRLEEEMVGGGSGDGDAVPPEDGPDRDRGGGSPESYFRR